MKQIQTSSQVRTLLAVAGVAALALGASGCHSDEPAATTAGPAPASAAQTAPAAAQTGPLPAEAKQQLQEMSPANKEKYQKLMNQAQGGAAGH